MLWGECGWKELRSLKALVGCSQALVVLKWTGKKCEQGRAFGVMPTWDLELGKAGRPLLWSRITIALLGTTVCLLHSILLVPCLSREG